MVTTTSASEASFPNLLVDRRRALTSDINSMTTGKAATYLYAISDEHSDKVRWCSVAKLMRPALTKGTLQDAIFTRGYATSGVIFHTEAGAQLLRSSGRPDL